MNIHYNRYKREIKGLRKQFWQVVYELGSIEEVSRMDIDTFLEAFSALSVIREREGGG
ncbi:hypothetical protein [Orenia marismortui]|uniref:hypothetical protein n=1 Tax=Orenia marismortui TaxID=46469 RepID=UPI00141700A5|nr:hypothetical protein [Orenia marismortui]